MFTSKPTFHLELQDFPEYVSGVGYDDPEDPVKDQYGNMRKEYRFQKYDGFRDRDPE